MTNTTHAIAPAHYILENIQQSYADRVVLDIPHLAIEKGKITALLGHNGSGKTTLLRMLAFLATPSAGVLYYNNVPVQDAVPLQLRREVSLLPQDPYLLHRSVHANITYGLKVRGESVTQAKVDAVLNQVGLVPQEFSHRMWSELSGGEAHRVALAARLVFKPQVLLLDEPTASLDEESCELVGKLLVQLQQQGMTIIVISHDKDWISFADNSLLLRKGKLVE